jgi:ABC-type polysaccharide/polyol phosphate transport system ATPase subunit
MSAIKLIDVGKKFILSGQRDRAGVGLFSAFPRQKVFTEFWALRKISMDIERGKIVGIIGRNGAGKTTLLNILSGISDPTTGKIEVEGKISSFLTLGAGFQDELTGRENIYLNSSILNISRNEINKKFRSILEFSELNGFLDFPLKTYSQGMRLRLGFSVAIHMDFDILLIDEILSVGDVSFQKRCFDRIEAYKKEGKTMIITSQSLDTIGRLCSEVFLLENGEIVESGHPEKTINRYLCLLDEMRLSDMLNRRYHISKWWADKRFWDREEGSKEAKIIEVKTYNSSGRQTASFKSKDILKIKVRFVVDEEIEEPHFGVAIFREDGVYFYGPNTKFDGYKIDKLTKGEGFFSIEYNLSSFCPGIYRFSVAIWDKNEVWAYDYHVGCYKFEITDQDNDGQLLKLEYKWEPDERLFKLNIFGQKKPDILSYISCRKQEIAPVSGIELSSINLSDVLENAKNTFITKESIKIRLKFKLTGDATSYYLWVGLFRDDDIYCHGAFRKLSAETATLVYEDSPLLAGDYYLSVGLWPANQKEPALYKHKAAAFKMSFSGQDHGTIYLDHSWAWELPRQI